jgi:predicted  nucleic acid-binding Zn-ribbon protein
MEEQIHQLIRLQEIDNEIGQIKARVLDHPKVRAGIDQELEGARRDYELLLEELEAFKKMRRGVEKEVEELEQRIKKSRAKLMEVKNNKEYKAMLTEIDDLTKAKSAQEDDLLEMMAKLETLTAQVQERRKLAEAKAAEGQIQKDALEQAAESCARELAELETRRREVEVRIEKPVLGKYEFLRDRLQGLAMAEARQGACLVCHIHIPPQMYNELQRRDRLIACPNCHRILYFDSLNGAAKA